MQSFDYRNICPPHHYSRSNSWFSSKLSVLVSTIQINPKLSLQGWGCLRGAKPLFLFLPPPLLKIPLALPLRKGEVDSRLRGNDNPSWRLLRRPDFIGTPQNDIKRPQEGGQGDGVIKNEILRCDKNDSLLSLSGLTRQSSPPCPLWIPAFAGMTLYGNDIIV